MSAPEATPRLADSLRSLAECQLQVQTARSAALDAGALGVMAVDVAAAAIVIGARGNTTFGVVALILLGLSLGLAVRTLRLPGAEETGPSITAIRKARASRDDNELEESLLDDLAEDLQTNDRALARKGPLFDRALTLLVLATIVEARREAMMSAMKPSTTSRHVAPEPTDTTETAKPEKAHGDRHFEQMKIPSLGGTGPILPEWLRKRFRRKDTSAVR